MVSILGAGLLVGTALAVIIPEGVHALYEPQQHGEGNLANSTCALTLKEEIQTSF